MPPGTFEASGSATAVRHGRGSRQRAPHRAARGAGRRRHGQRVGADGATGSPPRRAAPRAARRVGRRGVRTVTAMPLVHVDLGITGIADVVELHQTPDGDRAFPVEYKRGRKRPDMADEVQLCAQAICLEEMLKVKIKCGAIYYGEPKKRTEIDLSPSLRESVRQLCARAEVLQKGRDKAAMNAGTHCKNCSMKDFCLPELTFADHSKKYLISLYKT